MFDIVETIIWYFFYNYIINELYWMETCFSCSQNIIVNLNILEIVVVSTILFFIVIMVAEIIICLTKL